MKNSRTAPLFWILTLLVWTLPFQAITPAPLYGQSPRANEEDEGYIINFNNVNIVEYIRFISKISGKNFIFNDNELNFNVTIVSDEPTSLDNIMAALMHSLRIQGLTMLEQGNNLIIHRNFDIRTPPNLDENGVRPRSAISGSEIITRLYHIQNANPETVANVVRSMLSTQATLQVVPETRYLVLTDITSNVERVSALIKSIDTPEANLDIGQYRVSRTAIAPLVDLAQRIMTPIAGEEQLLLIPHNPSSAIFIVAPPQLVKRSLEVLALLDGGTATTTGTTPITEAQREQIIRERLGGENGRLSQRLIDEESGLPLTDQQIRQRNIQLTEEERIALQTERQFIDSIPFGGETIDLGFLGPQDGQRVTGGIQPLPEASEEDRWLEVLPSDAFERTSFGMVKLANRRGDQLQSALQTLADRLVEFGQFNAEITSTINTVQWIENSNTIVFSGPDNAVERVTGLIKALDTPVRQVFIEMLILETTVDNSLSFGVDWGIRDSSSDFALGSGFNREGTGLATALNNVELGDGILTANNLASAAGFNLGVIGRAITRNGQSFGSLSALLQAVNDDSEVEVVLNPKIIAEDNTTAEIFVGTNTRFRGQSITNDEGSVITTNFEFRDVGIRMRVTPFLGTGDTITLEIEQEVSSASESDEEVSSIAIEAGPVTRRSTTTTRVHVPDRYFLIISGMIQEEKRRSRNRVPCLGGMPIVGGAFGSDNKVTAKRNLMIFIRPQIIDSEEKMTELTKHAQEQYKNHNPSRDLFRQEVDAGLEFLNLPNPWHKKKPCEG